MIDFSKLKSSAEHSRHTDPIKIFNGLKKPNGVNDLFSSQADILRQWHESKDSTNIVIKLNTGGGKTLVGLLIALSSMNELRLPALYLVENKQLVDQVCDVAKSFGISASKYEPGSLERAEFVNGDEILVGAYESLFNGRSKFGLSGAPCHTKVGCIVVDDAHASIDRIRKAFTLSVDRGHFDDAFVALSKLFIATFMEIDKGSLLEDFLEGKGGTGTQTIEVPFWAWHDEVDTIRAELNKRYRALEDRVRNSTTSGAQSYDCETWENEFRLKWPVLRDRLKYTRGIISPQGLTIVPYLPFIDLFPSFMESQRKIFMSATFADDSAMVEAFGLDRNCVENEISSTSSAGIGKRLIIPYENEYGDISALASFAIKASKQGKGVVILAPSQKRAEEWADLGCKMAVGNNVPSAIEDIKKNPCVGPLVLANRYNGIDLPGESCRVLILDQLPSGFDDYVKNQEAILGGSSLFERNLAERIEQGMGRGLRGSSDYCAVVLFGNSLIQWVKVDDHRRLFTKSTRAQASIWNDLKGQVSNREQCEESILQAANGDEDFQEYISFKTSELMEADSSEDTNRENIDFALAERFVFDHWLRRDYSGMIQAVRKYTDSLCSDKKMVGFLCQFAACIYWDVGNEKQAYYWQNRAHSCNPVLPHPAWKRDDITLRIQAICSFANIKQLKSREKLVSALDGIEKSLAPEASSNNFEEAFCKLGAFLGFESQRTDNRVDKGPDNLWMIPGEGALVVEAKSRSRETNVFNKDWCGQLLVAGEWFQAKYPNMPYELISVHPTGLCTPESHASSKCKALLLERLPEVVNKAREIAVVVYEDPRDDEAVIASCERMLESEKLLLNDFIDTYLTPFKVEASFNEVFD